MDFVSNTLFDGRRLRALTVVDTYTREALAIDVDQGIKGEQVVEAMARIAGTRGSPKSFLPGDLEAQIEAFVDHYNHRRYHESLKNVTPADAYFGRACATIQQRERIKRKTIEHRRLQHRKLAA